MPVYTLPKRKKSKSHDAMGIEMDTDWRRRVSLPANAEIVKATKVGDKVEVTLMANVTGVSMRKSDGDESCDLDLDLDSVACYPAKKGESVGDYMKRRRKQTY